MRYLRIAALVFAAFSSTPILANETMNQLLVPGRKLVIESASGRVEIAFAADGTYTTSTGSYGTWTLEGDRLCTVTRDEVRSCGALPPDLQPGERRVTTDYDQNEVTISIE